MAPLIRAEDISKHNGLDNLWTVVDGTVYDLTEFAPEHPGGVDVLSKYAGRDATAAYNEVHAPSLIRSTLPRSKHIGPLDTSTVPPGWSESARTQNQVNTRPDTSKPPLDSLINTHDFEIAASKSFTAKTWAFVSSAATDLHTKTRNSSAYSSIGLRPRVLHDVSNVCTRTTMLGQPMRTPIFCSPTSLGRLVHPDGEKELGRACKNLGIPQCVSTSASFPLAELVTAVRSHQADTDYDLPFFFQLYVDKKRANSERLLREAAELGIKGVFLTVDAPIPGKREADERMQADESISSPMSGAKAKNDKKGGALGRLMGAYIDDSLQWSDLAWLRECAPGVPIVLKGIQTAMDAVKAMEAGVDAILISNHGGRSLDTAPATILVLLELHKCCPEIFDKMEVFVDGGVSRGTDVFKALCLGAKAVGIGRGFLYGLNYGQEGVERYIDSELNPHVVVGLHPRYLNTWA